MEAIRSASSTKSFTVAAAAMKNLGVIDFKAEPSAQAEHIYEDGILTGSRISLNLGIPECRYLPSARRLYRFRHCIHLLQQIPGRYGCRH